MNISKGYGLQYRKHRLLDKLKVKVIEFGIKEKFPLGSMIRTTIDGDDYKFANSIKLPNYYEWDNNHDESFIDKNKNSFSNWVYEFEKSANLGMSEAEVRKSVAIQYLKGSD